MLRRGGLAKVAVWYEALKDGSTRVLSSNKSDDANITNGYGDA